MSKTIYKYELEITDSQVVKMPVGAKILSIHIQNGIPCIWALVNPNEKSTTGTIIETYGTGHGIGYDISLGGIFIGTYQTKGLVFHVFEYIGL